VITSVAAVAGYHLAVQACIVHCIYHYQRGKCWRDQMLQGPRTTMNAALPSIHQHTDGISC